MSKKKKGGVRGYRVRSYKVDQVPYPLSSARLRSPSSPTHVFFCANLYKILPPLRVVIAKSHVNASGLNFDILFPCGSGDIGHVRKSANRGGVCKELSCPNLKTKHVWEREGSTSASCMTGLGLGNGTMRKAI